MVRRNWTREELILAFNLYCKIPFGMFHNRNPKVIELAAIIERSPNAVALKLCNFASFDPNHKSRGIKGMQNASKLDRQIWEEFTNNWEECISESEKLLSEYQAQDIEEDITTKQTIKQGEDKVRKIKTRINQNFFREVILSNYFRTCAICGLNISELLIASHVIPWSLNQKERLNPQNGICLCALHDKAFDRGFISISSDYRIILSPQLIDEQNHTYFPMYFGKYKNASINLPDKFLPSPEFLTFHLEHIFRK